MDYLERLQGMSRDQLLDHVEAVWRGEETITDLEREQLKEEILLRKALDSGNYVIFYGVLLSLVEITRQAQAKKDPEKKLTLAQLAGAALVMYLYMELPKPYFEPGFDYIWVTEQDDKVCPICKPLHGVKVNELQYVISTHPGCRCGIKKVPKVIRAMDKIGLIEAGAVRAIKDGKKRILEVLAAPFGSPSRKDKLGQYLSPNTDFMIDMGDRRPLMYLHGYSPRKRALKTPFSIGVATATKVDSKGLWMRAELDNSELSDRTWSAALEGNARASTGSVNYLERHDEHTGEVHCWPIAELSVFDAGDDRIPVSDDAVVLPLRALFTEQGIDYTFEAGEDKDEAIRSTKTEEKGIDMNEVQKAVDEALAARDAAEAKKAEEKAALRAEIEAELKEAPAYRSTFNIGGKHAKRAKLTKEDEENGFDLSDIEASQEYMWNLRHPRQAGIATRDAKRDLDETTAAEGLAITPDKTLHKLGEYRRAKSFGRKAGMTIYQTDSLVLDIPMATTGIIALPTIAEEGPYTDLEPVLATVTATIEKHGGYVDVTEELMEDQDLFEPWLYRSIGQGLGLAENVSLVAVMETGAGVASAGVGAITKPEVMAWYHALAGEYRPGACFFMPDDLLAYLRANESANSPTYGVHSGFSWGLGEKDEERFMGKRVFTDANWTDWATAAAADECAAFSNLEAGYAFVERRGIKILVDPYIGGLNGIVRYYFSARYDFVEVDPNATALLNGGP